MKKFPSKFFLTITIIFSSIISVISNHNKHISERNYSLTSTINYKKNVNSSDNKFLSLIAAKKADKIQTETNNTLCNYDDIAFILSGAILCAVLVSLFIAVAIKLKPRILKFVDSHEGEMNSLETLEHNSTTVDSNATIINYRDFNLSYNFVEIHEDEFDAFRFDDSDIYRVRSHEDEN